jgi:hypothetical protein
MPSLKAQKSLESNAVTAAVSPGNRMTNSIRPFFGQCPSPAMSPAHHTQKLSPTINARFGGVAAGFCTFLTPRGEFNVVTRIVPIAWSDP